MVCTASTKSELQEVINRESIHIVTAEPASVIRKNGPYGHATELKKEPRHPGVLNTVNRGVVADKRCRAPDGKRVITAE